RTASGIGLYAESKSLVLVGGAVTERNLRGLHPGAAAFGICVYRIVIAAGRIERGSVRCPDQADMSVRLLDHLLEGGLPLVIARNVIEKDELRRICLFAIPARTLK